MLDTFCVQLNKSSIYIDEGNPVFISDNQIATCLSECVYACPENKNEQK